MNRWICGDLGQICEYIYLTDGESYIYKLEDELRGKLSKIIDERCLVDNKLVRYNCNNRMDKLFDKLDEYLIPLNQEFISGGYLDNLQKKYKKMTIIGLSYFHNFDSLCRTQKERDDLRKSLIDRYGHCIDRTHRDVMFYFCFREQYIPKNKPEIIKKIDMLIWYYAMVTKTYMMPTSYPFLDE
jgi:hypothetical protein